MAAAAAVSAPGPELAELVRAREREQVLAPELEQVLVPEQALEVLEQAPEPAQGHSVRIVASFTNARGEICQVVEQSVVITGERALATGTLCQQADGSWTLIDGRSSSGAAGFSGSTVPPP